MQLHEAFFQNHQYVPDIHNFKTYEHNDKRNIEMPASGYKGMLHMQVNHQSLVPEWATDAS